MATVAGFPSVEKRPALPPRPAATERHRGGQPAGTVFARDDNEKEWTGWEAQRSTPVQTCNGCDVADEKQGRIMGVRKTVITTVMVVSSFCMDGWAQRGRGP